MSSWARRVLVTLYAALALGAALTLTFALYVYRVRTSPLIANLERQSDRYPCIGQPLSPRRPKDRPAFHLARRYLLDGESRAPSLSWHFELEATGHAIEAAFRPHEVNRMYAALPIGRYRGFDGVALALIGRRFCNLDERQKEAVREFGRSGRRRGLPALHPAAGIA